MVSNTNNQEEDNKPPEKEWFHIMAICTAALSALSAAVIFNWTSPTIPILISSKEYQPIIDIDLASYLTVIPPVVTIFVSPFYSLFTDKCGRKYPLLSIGILHICCWICVMFATNIYMFYLSRVFFGIADAAMFGVLPVYIAEVATPKVRGSWGNAMGFSIYCGQLIMNLIGHYLSIRVSAYILVGIPILFLLLFLMMPETPYYYLMKGKTEDAEKSLKRLRRSDDVSAELERITKDVQKLLSENATFKDCFVNKTNRKAILLVALARGMQQFSGISAFAVYTQFIFQEGVPSMDRGIASTWYTGALVVCSFIGSIITDKLGRKSSLMISCFGCAVCLLAEAVYFYLKAETTTDLSNISWFPIAGMIAYVLFFCAGLGLTPILLLSELFSTTIRGKATSILTIIFCIYVSVITKVFQLLTTNFGLYVPFLIFSVLTFFNVMLSFVFIPETRGKTLEEIQEMLRGYSDKNKPV